MVVDFLCGAVAALVTLVVFYLLICGIDSFVFWTQRVVATYRQPRVALVYQNITVMERWRGELMKRKGADIVRIDQSRAKLKSGEKIFFVDINSKKKPKRLDLIYVQDDISQWRIDELAKLMDEPDQRRIYKCAKDG